MRQSRTATAPVVVAAAELPVHPLAAAFPMMSDEELAELAADIKAHGLIHPIVLDLAGEMLIDGRNRRRACEIAGIEPVYRRLAGEDPVAFIVSANLARRNLSKGQQAMLYAIAYPEPEKGGRGQKGLGDRKVSAERVSVARTVLRLAPDLVDLVLAGKSLDEAYTEAQRRKNVAQSEEAQLQRLQAEAADLAELVAEQRMSLPEATAALNQRREDQRRAIDAGRRAAAELLNIRAVALAIVGAMELGEHDVVSPEHLDGMREALKLLEDRALGERHE